MNNVAFLAVSILFLQRSFTSFSPCLSSDHASAFRHLFIYVTDGFLRSPRPLVVCSVTFVSLGMCDCRPIGQGMQGFVIGWKSLSSSEISDIQQTEDAKVKLSQIYWNAAEVMAKYVYQRKLYFCGNITETARDATLFIYFSTRIPMVSIKEQSFHGMWSKILTFQSHI